MNSTRSLNIRIPEDEFDALTLAHQTQHRSKTEIVRDYLRTLPKPDRQKKAKGRARR